MSRESYRKTSPVGGPSHEYEGGHGAQGIDGPRERQKFRVLADKVPLEMKEGTQSRTKRLFPAHESTHAFVRSFVNGTVGGVNEASTLIRANGFSWTRKHHRTVANYSLQGQLSMALKSPAGTTSFLEQRASGYLPWYLRLLAHPFSVLVFCCYCSFLGMKFNFEVTGLVKYCPKEKKNDGYTHGKICICIYRGR